MRDQSLEDDVVVQVDVDSTGSVIFTRLLFAKINEKGNPAFDSAAVAAARQWKFEAISIADAAPPGESRGEKVSLRFQFAVRPLSPDGEGTLCVLCRDHETSRALEFVEVSVPSGNVGPIFQGFGRFCITEASAGQHRIRITSLGYAPRDTTIEVKANRQDSLVVYLMRR